MYTFYIFTVSVLIHDANFNTLKIFLLRIKEHNIVLLILSLIFIYFFKQINLLLL